MIFSKQGKLNIKLKYFVTYPLSFVIATTHLFFIIYLVMGLPHETFGKASHGTTNVRTVQIDAQRRNVRYRIVSKPIVYQVVIEVQGCRVRFHVAMGWGFWVLRS